MLMSERTVEESVREDVLQRLRRIEGQVRGLQKMIEGGRNCEEVITQLAAVKAAIVNTAMTVLGSEMPHCMGVEPPEDTTRDKALEQFMKVFRKFS